MSAEIPISEHRAPDLWVLGGYGMTGGHLTLHTASTVASALAAGALVRCISLHPGAFGEGDVTRLPADLVDSAASNPPGGVVYLRSLCRLAGVGRAQRLGLWLRRLSRARELVRRTRSVALIVDGAGHPIGTRAVQGALAWLLTRDNPACAQFALSATPRRILRHVSLRMACGVPPDGAESTVFRHIQASRHAELRLTEAHVARALLGAGGADLSDAARRDILGLARTARQLMTRDVEAAMRQAIFTPPASAPRALQAAFAVGENGLPAIAQHLRGIGKRRRHWMRFVPPEARAAWTMPGLPGAVLRHLARQPRGADRGHLDALAKPLFDGPGAPSRLDWFLMLALRVPVEHIASLDAPWRCAHLANRLAQMCPPGDAANPDAPRLTLSGIASNGTGLAQNFWMSAHALRRAGLAPVLSPTDTRAEGLDTMPQTMSPQGLALTRDVTLYHLNADRIPQEILAEQGRPNRFNIGYLLWELDRIPAAHRLALEMLDEIWVPSVALKRLYQGAFAGEVVLMRKGIALPRPDLSDVPEKRGTRFLVCFDQRSSVARKNPIAAVHAFRAAFPGNTRAELIIKTTPVPPTQRGDPEGQMRLIRKIAEQDPRILIIEDHLPLPTLLGWIAASDALVSPHRAEGFGYLPAYALSLKVPVLATDHGGCRDFLNRDTAMPLPFDLVRVPRGHAIYPTPGAHWAEVCVPSLSAAMAALHDNPRPAQERARRGQLLMQTDYAMDALARRYAQRLSELGLIRETAGQDIPESRAALD